MRGIPWKATPTKDLRVRGVSDGAAEGPQSTKETGADPGAIGLEIG